MTASVVGYARISTIGNIADLHWQVRALTAAGCLKIFEEQVGSADGNRPEFCRAVDILTPGDTLVVTNLDRIARSTPNLIEVLKTLKTRGAELRVLALGLHTGTASGQQMVEAIELVAGFEHDLLRERQREGIAKAKSEGRYRGRTPSARQKTADVLRLSGEGLKAAAIAIQLQISETSVFRILREAPSAPNAVSEPAGRDLG